MLATELATTSQETTTLVLKRISKIGLSQVKYLWSILFIQRERAGVYWLSSSCPLTLIGQSLFWLLGPCPLCPLRRQQLYLLLLSLSKSETSEGWAELPRSGQTHTVNVGSEAASCPSGEGSGVRWFDSMAQSASFSKSLGQKDRYILERCVYWVDTTLSCQNILFTVPGSP